MVAILLITVWLSFDSGVPCVMLCPCTLQNLDHSPWIQIVKTRELTLDQSWRQKSQKIPFRSSHKSQTSLWLSVKNIFWRDGDDDNINNQRPLCYYYIISRERDLLSDSCNRLLIAHCDWRAHNCSNQSHYFQKEEKVTNDCRKNHT